MNARRLVARLALIVVLGCVAFAATAVAPNTQPQAQACFWCGGPGWGNWEWVGRVLDRIGDFVPGAGSPMPGWNDYPDKEPDEGEIVIVPPEEFRPGTVHICLRLPCTFALSGIPGVLLPLEGWIEIPLDGGEITYSAEVAEVLTFEAATLIEWVNAGFSPDDYNVCAYWYWKSSL